MTRKKQADKAESQPAGDVIIAPENEVLVLRTCTRAPDGRLLGYGGFPWPESGPIHAPDEWDPAWGEKPHDYIGGWRPDIACGGGLHGCGDLTDDWSLLNWSIDAQAMIVATDGTKLVQVDGKVKFQSGIVRKLVSLAEGLCSLFVTRDRIEKQVSDIETEAKKDNDPKDAASGDASKLAASGDASQLAASGDASKLAASGCASQLAASGDASQLAASGDDSVAVSAGLNSRAKAGANGAIALTWHDGNRCRIAVGYVGENGIEADTWYRVSDAGQLEEVVP